MDFTLHSPESMGISSKKILDLAKYLDSHCSMHSMMVARNGKCLFEAYWHPFNGSLHMMNSFAKSVAVLAVGMAIDEGLITLEDRPSKLFAEYLPEVYDKRVDLITVKDLLRMTASTAKRSTNFIGVTSSWITHYFSHELPCPPGEKFSYESGATYMLSAIISKVYGKTLYDIINERIFIPLGINARWDSSPEGITCGGWGLYLSLRDMAKLSELFVNLGAYEGRQFVNREWLKECTKKQVDIKPFAMCNGYGYQFWTGLNDTFVAFGAIGQISICHPKSGTFIAIQSGCTNKELDLMENALAEFFSDTPKTSLPLNDNAFCELKKSAKEFKRKMPNSQRVPKSWSEKYDVLKIHDDFIEFNDNERHILAGCRYWHGITDNKRAAYSFSNDRITITSYDIESCFEEEIVLEKDGSRLICTIKKNAAISGNELITKKSF
ncbi:MAG: serine hydrolase [Christensenellaceae bacterium]|nr:serine hydrolase [Christensenellaceae bacterium]